MTKLSEFVAAWKGKKIIVVGDIIADVTIHGHTGRVSREAPVLILEEQTRTLSPGGAANVAANIKAMGGDPVLIGAVGDEEYDSGPELIQELKNRKISCRRIVSSWDRTTPTKTRIFAGGTNTVCQQMLRIDSKKNGAVSDTVHKEMKRHLANALKKSDILVVSDYDEGTIPAGWMWRDMLGFLVDTKIMVDSRHKLHDFNNGAYVMTPNEDELAELWKCPISNKTDLVLAGNELLEKLGCKNLLVKRGRNGMVMFNCEWWDCPRSTFVGPHGHGEVADVTGAGDTVLAAFSLATAAGATPEEAMTIANVAGGIKVTKSGTAVVSKDELEEALKKYKG